MIWKSPMTGLCYENADRVPLFPMSNSSYCMFQLINYCYDNWSSKGEETVSWWPKNTVEGTKTETTENLE